MQDELTRTSEVKTNSTNLSSTAGMPIAGSEPKKKVDSGNSKRKREEIDEEDNEVQQTKKQIRSSVREVDEDDMFSPTANMSDSQETLVSNKRKRSSSDLRVDLDSKKFKTAKSIFPEIFIPELNGDSKHEKDFIMYARNYENLRVSMPACAEKSLSLLYEYMKSEEARELEEARRKKEKARENTNIHPLFSRESIQHILLNLEKELILEGLCQDSKVNAAFNEIKTKFAQVVENPTRFKPSELANDSYNLLKYLRPVNLDLTLQFIHQSVQAARTLLDEDVILLLGRTGVGKSTMILKLAGEKLEKYKVSGNLNHIAPRTLKNPALSTFVTSPHGRSETRNINPIRIDIESISENNPGTVVLCDSPGFGDNRGVETDISNGIGIARALAGTRSIRPVVLLSKGSMGDRWENLYPLVKILSMFMPELTTHLPSFTYVFNKYAEGSDDVDEILPMLSDKETDLSPEEKAHKCYEPFLQDIIRKTTEKMIVFYPITDNPGSIIDAILQRPKITNPNTAIQDFLTPESMAALKDQLHKQQVAIEKALERVDIPLLSYKIKQLVELKESLVIPESKDLYEFCIGKVKKLIQDLQKKVVDRLSRYKTEIHLEHIKYDIEECAVSISALYQLEDVRVLYVPDLPDLRQFCATNILECQRNFSDSVVQDLEEGKFNNANFISATVLCLDKMKLFAEIIETVFSTLIAARPDFVDPLKTCYTTTVSLLKEKFDANVAEATSRLEGLLFVQFVMQMDLIDLMSGKYSDHITRNHIELSRDKLTQGFKTLIKEKASISAYVDGYVRGENTITAEQIKSNFSVLLSANHTIGIERFYDKPALEEAISSAETKIQEALSNVWNEVDALNLENDKFKKIHEFLSRFDSLRENDHIKDISDVFYRDVIRRIKDYVKNYKDDAYDILQPLNEGVLGMNFDINYALVKHSLSGLKAMQLFRVCKESIISNELEDLINLLNNFIDRAATKLREIPDNLSGLSNIKQMFVAASQLCGFIESELVIRDGATDSTPLTRRAVDSFNQKIVGLLKQLPAAFPNKMAGQFPPVNFLDIITFLSTCCDWSSEEEWTRDIQNILSLIQENTKTWSIAINTHFELIYQQFSMSDKLRGIDLDGTLIPEIQKMMEVISHMVDSEKSYQTDGGIHFSDKAIAVRDLHKQILHDIPESILQDWLAKFIAYQNQLMKDATKIERGTIDTLCLAKITIANTLQALDPFLPSEHQFSTAVDSLQRAIVQQQADQLSELKVLALAEKLSGFQEKYNELVNPDPSLKKKFVEAISILSNSLNKYHIVFEEKLGKFSRSDEGDIKILHGMVDVFAKVAHAYYVLRALRPDMLSEIQTNNFSSENSDSSDAVNKCLQSLQSSVSAYKFHYIESSLVELKSIQTLLNIEREMDIPELKNLSSQITKSIADITTSINRQLKEKTEFYSNLSLEEYSTTPPAVVFISQLEAAQEDGDQYKKAINQIKESIVNKITTTLDNADQDVSGEDINFMQLIYKVQPYIPSELYLACSHKIKETENRIETREIEFKEGLEKDIREYKLQGLVQKLDSAFNNRNFRHAQSIVDALHIAVANKANALCKNANHDMLDVITQSSAIWSDWNQCVNKLEEFSRQTRESTDAKWKNFFDKAFVEEAKEQIFAKIKLCYEHIFGELKDIIKSGNLGSSFRAIRAHLDKIRILIEKPDVAGENVFLSSFLKRFTDISEGINQISNSIAGLLIKLDNSIEANLNVCDWKNLKDILDTVREYNTLIDDCMHFLGTRETEPNLGVLVERMHWSAMQNRLNTRLEELETSTRLTYLHNERLKSGDVSVLGNFYKSISSSYNNLISAKPMSSHFRGGYEFDKIKSGCEAHIKSELKKVEEYLENDVKSFPFETREEYTEFNIWYRNLLSFRENFSDAILVQEAITHISYVERAYRNKLKSLQEEIVTVRKEPEKAVRELILIKIMSLELPYFLDVTKTGIDVALANISSHYEGNRDIGTIFLLLRNSNETDQPIALRLIAEQKAFKNYNVAIKNEETLRFTTGDVLQEIRGINLDQNKLRKAVESFQSIYWKLVEDGLSGVNAAKERITSETKRIIEESRDTFSVKIIKLTAYLFAYWTLDNSEGYSDMLTTGAEIVGDDNAATMRNYLLQPHPAQIISIFRMCGIDSNDEPKFENHLVQIGTGEGKSVTLAVTASILALLGYEVDCVCYSQYLSDRDYKAFKDLFKAFMVLSYVNYGTFNQLLEKTINREADVRELLVALIQNEKAYKDRQLVASRKKILLIDEVDVFFSEDFYGEYYRPLAELKGTVIQNFIRSIWNVRDNKEALTFSKVSSTVEYKACCEHYPGWEFLFDQAAKGMIADVKNFRDPEYFISKERDEIGYKEHDSVSFTRKHDYKTIFAYLQEHESGNISIGSLNKRLNMTVHCGIYSYAEIPKLYACIMGVTGTLESLSEPQKDILEKYNLTKQTYMPSVYGRNQLQFAGNSVDDLKIENRVGYFMAISNEIRNRLRGSTVPRAVLVFFEDKKVLDEFRVSSYFTALNMGDKAKIITEQTNAMEKDGLIAQATSPGNVTLLTRQFGRGTDFKCYDARLNTSGGIHVIQTFVSDSVTEETQIKGRTARQGKIGSYSMVLLENDLERYGLQEEDVKAMVDRREMYTRINEARAIFFEAQFMECSRCVDDIVKDHEKSMQFLEEALLPGDVEKVKIFLKEQVEFMVKVTETETGVPSVPSRTICLMDGTGSMQALITKSKNTVGEMFVRALNVLKEAKITASFEIQFVVFRNYDCKEETLLEWSSWEHDPDRLREFMSGVSAHGGTWEPEAIEIGLLHANQTAEKLPITQVLLIGDAPPNPPNYTHNEPDLITQGRKKYRGEDYWRTTAFSEKTNVKTEVVKLKEKNIPVHSFYVKKSAQANFEAIASETGGHSAELDINSPEGAKQLTDVVTERILSAVGGRERSEELIAIYRRKYGRGHIAASSSEGITSMADISSSRSGSTTSISTNSSSMFHRPDNASTRGMIEEIEEEKSDSVPVYPGMELQ